MEGLARVSDAVVRGDQEGGVGGEAEEGDERKLGLRLVGRVARGEAGEHIAEGEERELVDLQERRVAPRAVPQNGEEQGGEGDVLGRARGRQRLERTEGQEGSEGNRAGLQVARGDEQRVSIRRRPQIGTEISEIFIHRRARS